MKPVTSRRAVRNRQSRTALVLAASIAPVVCLSLAPSAQATTKTFSTTNADWTNGGNWTPSGAPTSLDDILVNSGASDMTLTASNLNAQFITYSSPSNRRLSNATGTATDSTLTLHGSGLNPLISVTNIGTFNLFGANTGSGTGTLILALNASGSLNVSGTGGLVISSVISEIGGARSLSKTGSGGLTLNGTNTFTGGFAIDEGLVSVNALTTAGTAQSLGQGTSAVSLGNASTAGTLSYSGAATSTDRDFILGAAGGGISTASDITYTGSVGGSGAFTKSGAGGLVLSGATGDLSGATSVNVTAGGLRLDNLTVNANRIGNSANVSLNGGALEFDDNAGTAVNESAGQLQLAGGGNTVNMVYAGGTAGSMTFSSLSRSTGATASFGLSNADNTNRTGDTKLTFTSAPALPAGIVGGWAVTGNTWATLSGNNLARYVDYNVDGNGNFDASGIGTTITTPTTLNTLRLVNVSGTPGSATINSGGSLQLSAGGILSDGADNSITGVGTLTAGSTAGSEMFVHVIGASDVTTISAPIVNNAGGAVNLIKAGAGTLLIDGADTYTGSTQINGGTLRLGASGSLPSTSTVEVTALGTLDVNAQTKSIGALSGGGSVTLGGGGGSLAFGGNGASTSFTGVISGTGSVQKLGAGTMTMNTTNTFTGSTTLGGTNGVDDGGVLIIDRDTAFGAAPGSATPGSINLYKGTLRLSGTSGATGVVTSAGPAGVLGVLVSINRGITLNAGNGLIEVPAGQYAEIPGIIADGTSGTSPLHKIGDGILDLRTNPGNTFTGGVIVDGGTLGVVKDANFGATTGNVQLNNGATIKWYSNASAAGLNAARTLTIGAGGGTVNWSHSSGVPQVNHQIASAAGNTLTKSGTNTVQVNVAQPSMNGDLRVIQGRWNTHADGAAGNGTIYLAPQDISPATAAGVAQLGIGGSNLNLNITQTNPIVFQPTGQGVTSFEVNNTNTLTLNGGISGAGGLTKGRVAGTTGTLVLGGSNSYSGDTTVLLGTLRVANGAAIPDSSTVVMANVASAVFDLANSSETVGGLSGGGATGGNTTLGTGTLTVNQSADSTYAGNITGAGGALAKSGAGTLTLSGTSSYTGGTNVSNGKLQVKKLHANNPVTITGGTLQVLDSSPTLPSHPSGDDAQVSQPKQLTISGTGTLDLGNNDMIIDYSASTPYGGTSPAAAIEALIAQGFNAGDWLGTGITSSTAASEDAAGNFVLGIVDNATLPQPYGISNGGDNFSGIDVPVESVLVKFTHRADINLDGLVTDADAILFSTNYEAGAPATWSIGDLDYDGVFSDNDSIIFGTYYDTGLAHLPEPASLGLLGVAAIGLLQRRRRR